ncbi:hypothetical protein ADUPG1_011880 [Aduncisulcus paluster]|uniref:Tubulin-folding cofactor D C-terminal domain-containing protein n=1 Tax=Aduncisulcus paluster TaxID=2918883 RepID=A0ABQ5JXG9_9EUKA|nr:hypothetical protein ADUPG1_011880 [Aduncisulcus paluster]
MLGHGLGVDMLAVQESSNRTNVTKLLASLSELQEELAILSAKMTVEKIDGLKDVAGSIFSFLLSPDMCKYSGLLKSARNRIGFSVRNIPKIDQHKVSKKLESIWGEGIDAIGKEGEENEEGKEGKKGSLSTTSPTIIERKSFFDDPDTLISNGTGDNVILTKEELFSAYLRSPTCSPYLISCLIEIPGFRDAVIEGMIIMGGDASQEIAKPVLRSLDIFLRKDGTKEAVDFFRGHKLLALLHDWADIDRIHPLLSFIERLFSSSMVICESIPNHTIADLTEKCIDLCRKTSNVKRMCGSVVVLCVILHIHGEDSAIRTKILRCLTVLIAHTKFPVLRSTVARELGAVLALCTFFSDKQVCEAEEILLEENGNIWIQKKELAMRQRDKLCLSLGIPKPKPKAKPQAK